MICILYRQNHDVPNHPHSLFSLGICRFSAYASPRAYGEACVPFGGNVFFSPSKQGEILDDQSDQSPKKRRNMEDIHGDVGGSSSHQGFQYVSILSHGPNDLDEKRATPRGKCGVFCRWTLGHQRVIQPIDDGVTLQFQRWR